MANKPDKAELQGLGFLFPEELEIAALPTVAAARDETMSEETEVALIELGRQASDGEFNPEDQSTWPDFSVEQQEKDSAKRLSRHTDVQAVNKRWGTAMRNGLDADNASRLESILTDAKKLAAVSVKAELGEALKTLAPSATRTDVRQFVERYKASLVKGTLEKFGARLEYVSHKEQHQYVTIAQFEAGYLGRAKSHAQRESLVVRVCGCTLAGVHRGSTGTA
jgi:hypothetical protein